jgi:hypothetical protein
MKSITELKKGEEKKVLGTMTPELIYSVVVPARKSLQKMKDQYS